eukprot:4392342-Pleurochrysis_carterae.AAC.1
MSRVRPSTSCNVTVVKSRPPHQTCILEVTPHWSAHTLAVLLEHARGYYKLLGQSCVLLLALVRSCKRSN